MRLSFPHPLQYWYEVGMLKVPVVIYLLYLILRFIFLLPVQYFMYTVLHYNKRTVPGSYFFTTTTYICLHTYSTVLGIIFRIHGRPGSSEVPCNL